MVVQFGREICGELDSASQREWLVTNGIGGYACGSISGILNRHYHGLLVAALKPPLARTLLFTKLDESVDYVGKSWPLFSNRWSDGTITPKGYQFIEQFCLDGAIPVWTFACGDALLEKRIWMEQGANTTYIRYTLKRASQPLSLSLKALVNYRDQHGYTQSEDWQMQVNVLSQGVEIQAFETAFPIYLLATGAEVSTAHSWYCGYTLATEQYRGLYPHDDHLHVANFAVDLTMGQSFTLVASTLSRVELDGAAALRRQRLHEQTLIGYWYTAPESKQAPLWLEQLVLAADQFIVERTVAGIPGKTVIAGYPWFGDWGRDTMIALPGLAIATNRPDIAKPILNTFAQYLDQGMLPNLFPEVGQEPEYNTVDAILWYFEAVRAYYKATRDNTFLKALFPILEEVIDWHQKGTRYNIHMDDDGLLYAGEPGVQLTWMDAKVGDWVITPRMGKPVEINALWYNALISMVGFAQHIGRPNHHYAQLAERVAKGFEQFWNPQTGYCYDVLNGPDGNDETMRPNQIFAVSLPATQTPLLSQPEQQQSVVDAVAQQLLTSHGLRSLSPQHPDYQGQYGGSPLQRDSAYHQGPVWGWLIGHFVQAHLKVYKNPDLAQSFLDPMADHLNAGCVGTLSEIFDGAPPHSPRGAFAQAWTVAEVLRAYRLIGTELSVN
ncbi:MAG: amylo-alpha-1,6-glucosidase [Cyanobacteria bacterium P01_D01_bin.156]